RTHLVPFPYRSSDPSLYLYLLFFFHAPAPPWIYTLSLHDALPISGISSLSGLPRQGHRAVAALSHLSGKRRGPRRETDQRRDPRDRKSTRLNSSHSQISYAVFCLKKKTNVRHASTLKRTTPTTHRP